MAKHNQIAIAGLSEIILANVKASFVLFSRVNAFLRIPFGPLPVSGQAEKRDSCSPPSDIKAEIKELKRQKDKR